MSAVHQGGQRFALALAMALASTSAACVTTGGSQAVALPPGEEARPDAPEGRGEGDSRDELEARMHKLVAEQQSRVEAASGSPKACEDLCSLATSICGVREKLCAIADDHPGEEGYQGLCREAKQECQAAQNDCVRCVERHASGDAVHGASGEPTPAAATATPTPKP